MCHEINIFVFFFTLRQMYGFVKLVLLNSTILWRIMCFQHASACNCFNEDNVSFFSPNFISCFCDGLSENIFPTFENNINILTLRRYNIDILQASHITNLKESLVDIQLTELYRLTNVQKNTFDGFTKLQSLSISKVPALLDLSLNIFKNQNNDLRFLEITKTGLIKLPEIRLGGKFINNINFEGNSIQLIKTNNIMVQADQVIFDFNKIRIVEPWSFNNSKISKISLRNNPHLTVLTEEAFYGLESLTVLDLSETSIRKVPSTGLNELEVLIIKRTYTLKTIPSIYDFPKLKKADLTFSFHCCAFQLPQKHRPERYTSYKELSEKIAKLCSQGKTWLDRSSKEESSSEEDEEWHNSAVAPSNHHLSSSKNVDKKSLIGFNFENTPTTFNLLAICGSLRFEKEPIDCAPEPNAFNPCEDIMGYTWLRFSVWHVLIFGLLGNTCVLTVILCKPSEMSVQNFLISNLAFSDFLMAIYLLLLATEDAISHGYYFNYAHDWQRGIGCQAAGFVTIFSSQLSIFILCFLTIERWFTIKRALHLHKLNFQKTILIASCGWLYALIMATLPLVGTSNYSKTSLCLPMDTESILDKLYVLFLLLFGMIASVIVCICYYQIYFSLNYETRHKNGEYVLARKMTILVATNFLCWTPIIFFGLTALLGYPLINITNSKILLVFFYPLNSCANPFLYAILTTNFKKNFIHLVSKFGFCKEAKENYRLVYYQPRGPYGNQIQRPITSETAL